MSDWTIETLKEHFEAELAARDRAIMLQAREYERRLSELNHVHERAVEDARTFMRQDMYEQRHASLEQSIATLADRVNAQESLSRGFDLARGRLFAAIGMLVGVITVVVVLVDHFGK